MEQNSQKSEASGTSQKKGRVRKSADAFRTISEVAKVLEVPQHVLRFWETKFPQVKPLKRGGGRRYYRPDDVDILRRIQHLLYEEGYTIKGVQKLLKDNKGKLLEVIKEEPPTSDLLDPDVPVNTVGEAKDMADEEPHAQAGESAPAVAPSLPLDTAPVSRPQALQQGGLSQDKRNQLARALSELRSIKEDLKALA